MKHYHDVELFDKFSVLVVIGSGNGGKSRIGNTQSLSLRGGTGHPG